MKKKVLTRLILLIMLCIAIGFIKPSKASAYDYGLQVNIPLVTVTNIDNVPYPSTYNMFFYGDNVRNYSKFTIESPGEVKAYFRWTSSNNGRGTAWFSRDVNGYDIVGSTAELNYSNNSLKVFLDTGTYYLNCTWTTEAYDVGAALLYEDGQSEELMDVSSFDNPNPIVFDKTTRGFITDTAPNDYYVFTLDKKALVTIAFSFDKDNYTRYDGYATLYNEFQIELANKRYTRTTQGAEVINQQLQPGTYYIRLTGINGGTTLNVSPMYYDITLKPEVTSGWTKGPMKVFIDTTIDYVDIVAVSRRVYEDDIKNTEIWMKSIYNQYYIPVEGNAFEVTKNGTYSVRIEDKFGNYELKTIKITTMDTTEPKVSGVSDGKYYKSPVTIKWSDSQSGIKSSKVTLNGKKVKSGIKVTEAGKYTLKVYDKVGNVKKVVFYLDFKAPTISGASNGKTYKTAVTMTFKDNLSGIKKVTVNDEEITLSGNKYSVWADGTYTVKVWDNAGNTKKIKFKVKRS